MRKIFYLTFSVLALALAACGDNIKGGDGPPDMGGDGNCFDQDCPTAVDQPDAGLPDSAEVGSDAGACDGSDASDGACEPGKTLLCHAPSGNPSGTRDICVGDAAVQAHLAHGDALGACP